MQSDILKKIDVLVAMAGASPNVGPLHAEKNEIELEYGELEQELAILATDQSIDKYFKVSEKQVDENIKVSLEAKIRRQENSLKILQKQISSVSIDEARLHEEIINIKNELTSSKEYISALNERIKTITDATSLENFKTILKDENLHVEDLTTTLKEKESEYSSTLEKLNYFDLARKEIQARLDGDKERLVETKASLVNPSSYVDEDLKKQDEARIESIKERLSELDKRKLEIITDPAMIANEAKKLIVADDRVTALSKVKELVTIVKAKPFMDMVEDTDINTVLQEELENASNRRDEYAILIDSKNYDMADTSVITDRINYLTSQIASFEDKIRSLQEEVKRLDDTEFRMLTEKVNDTTKLSKELEQSIKAYNDIIRNSEEKTPKRRAILNAAFQRKQKDLENVRLIVEKYKKDQKTLVKRTYDIESIEILKCRENIKLLQEEINMLNSILIDVSNAKDVLAIEDDKKKLKELDDMVKAIKHRQKFNESPSSIYDEIEIYLGTMDDETREMPSLDNFKFKKVDFNQKEMEPVVLESDNIDVNEVMNELPKMNFEDNSFDETEISGENDKIAFNDETNTEK